jgi:hypothetical protein
MTLGCSPEAKGRSQAHFAPFLLEAGAFGLVDGMASTSSGKVDDAVALTLCRRCVTIPSSRRRSTLSD